MRKDGKGWEKRSSCYQEMGRRVPATRLHSPPESGLCGYTPLQSLPRFPIPLLSANICGSHYQSVCFISLLVHIKERTRLLVPITPSAHVAEIHVMNLKFPSLLMSHVENNRTPGDWTFQVFFSSFIFFRCTGTYKNILKEHYLGCKVSKVRNYLN